MNSLRIEEGVIEFLRKLERKHAGQLAVRILSLANEARPADTKPLRGMQVELLRVDQGEFRIIYQVNAAEVTVILVGRRNDDEVYKQIKRKGF